MYLVPVPPLVRCIVLYGEPMTFDGMATRPTMSSTPRSAGSDRDCCLIKRVACVSQRNEGAHHRHRWCLSATGDIINPGVGAYGLGIDRRPRADAPRCRGLQGRCGKRPAEDVFRVHAPMPSSIWQPSHISLQVARSDSRLISVVPEQCGSTEKHTAFKLPSSLADTRCRCRRRCTSVPYGR